MLDKPNEKVFKETLMTEDDKHLEAQMRVSRARIGTEQLIEVRE